MSQSNYNKLMFETLDKLVKIDTSRVSMWPEENQYAYPLFFRFNFKDKLRENINYNKLKEIINNYKGNLTWVILHDENRSAHYFILPEIFSPFIFKKDFTYEKDSFFIFFSEAQYYSLIDKAVGDIPLLCEYIFRNW